METYAPFVANHIRGDFIFGKAGKDDNHFRLIANKDLIDNQPDPPALELKALGVTGSGSYAMSREPTWRSQIKIGGEWLNVDNGKFTFTEMDPRGTKRVAGTLELQAGGTRATCRFAMPITVVDIGAVKQ